MPEKLSKLKLIKTDVEGFDYKLFKINQHLIKTYRPAFPKQTFDLFAVPREWEFSLED